MFIFIRKKTQSTMDDFLFCWKFFRFKLIKLKQDELRRKWFLITSKSVKKLIIWNFTSFCIAFTYFLSFIYAVKFRCNLRLTEKKMVHDSTFFLGFCLLNSNKHRHPFFRSFLPSALLSRSSEQHIPWLLNIQSLSSNDKHWIQDFFPVRRSHQAFSVQKEENEYFFSGNKFIYGQQKQYLTVLFVRC